MRFALAVSAAGPVWMAAAPAVAQYQPPSETLMMTGDAAATWTEGDTDVIVLSGPVTIEVERATLTASQAVIWLTPEAGNEPNRQRAQIALVGNARVKQPNATRVGERMLVNASVAGTIRLTAQRREERDLSGTASYQSANAMRRGDMEPTPPAGTGGSAVGAATQPGSTALTEGVTQAPPMQPPASLQRPATTQSPRPTAESQPAGAADRAESGRTSASNPSGSPSSGRRGTSSPGRSSTRPATVSATTSTAPTTASSTAPTSQATLPTTPVFFEAPQIETQLGDDGYVIAILSQGVKIVHRTATNDLIELQGQRVVLFTTLKSLKPSEQSQSLQDSIIACYIEGDVRAVYTPADQSKMGEGRIEASRLYYEFATDRAILTDAILHTIEPKAQMPIIVHAKTMRQLALNEYRAEDAELSTSFFAVPTYSIKADKIYVRQDKSEAGQTGSTVFDAESTTFRAFGVPFFWLPRAGGDLSDNKLPIRSVAFGQSQAFGTEFETEWGLFETLGKPAPHDLDAAYKLDYFTDRGPAAGFNARYQGSTVLGADNEPFSFSGQFRSYFVYDEGQDDFGRFIAPPPADDPYRLRGQVLWEHQHILPDNWQVQLRAGFVSDPNFLEQWFPRQFDRELPHDVSVYLKHQQDTEAFTLLAQAQPNEQVTTSDLEQEQFEVEHLPEIGYRRIGDAVGPGTFYSDNLVSGLHFQQSRYTLQEQGFYPKRGVSPGIPSLGLTGVTDDTIWRSDFREEFDFPFTAGAFRVTPYLIGRYTGYTDSPDDGQINRLFGGAGARVTTAFWKVDDTAESRFFDIHRLRHVVEPEVNVFTSGTTVDRSDVYVYDEQIDPINDISAVQLALRQRWQTYRGGPGRWRSVDFLTLNVEADFFSNQPDDFTRRPVGFRGLFYPTLPENSVPRNAINSDLTWRIADTTAVLADAQWNIDENRLATAAIGLVVQRDERMSYFIGTRYIDELSSNITTVAGDYQISSRYNLAIAQSFDFGTGENVVSSASVIRRFDTLFLIVKAFYNETTGQNGFGVGLVPRGLAAGVDSDVLNTALENRQR